MRLLGQDPQKLWISCGSQNGLTPHSQVISDFWEIRSHLTAAISNCALFFLFFLFCLLSTPVTFHQPVTFCYLSLSILLHLHPAAHQSVLFAINFSSSTASIFFFFSSISHHPLLRPRVLTYHLLSTYHSWSTIYFSASIFLILSLISHYWLFFLHY